MIISTAFSQRLDQTSRLIQEEVSMGTFRSAGVPSQASSIPRCDRSFSPSMYPLRYDARAAVQTMRNHIVNELSVKAYRMSEQAKTARGVLPLPRHPSGSSSSINERMESWRRSKDVRHYKDENKTRT